MTQKTVFVINSGSSSLKYQLVDPATGECFVSGLAECIGQADGHIRHRLPDNTIDEILPLPDHETALHRVIELCEKHGPDLEKSHLIGMGHRVVQGGSWFDRAVLADIPVRERIGELAQLAPLHNPANLKGIEVARRLWPDIPHVAVFDSAFFAHLPAPAATYAINQSVAHEYQIRRYGAHGTSHRYVSEQVSKYMGTVAGWSTDRLAGLRQIVLHLGNGASACAVLGNKPQDTSMGMTPLEGLVMGTRTGDIDPAVVFHLARTGMSVERIDQIFNQESGLKGLCGDNDMRQVWKRLNQGDGTAKLALETYIHRLRKYVGAYTSVLEGLDVLTFTAGIGENDYHIRQWLTSRLTWLGVEIDQAANEEGGHKVDPQLVDGADIRVISKPESKVTVLVVPTNEELMIARQVVEVIHGG